MTLGHKIQEIRTGRKMSQEQFGEMLDVSRQTVSKWELDQAVPDLRKIVAISRLYCVPTDDLLINVTNFVDEGVRFACGVYRGDNCEIVETEKILLEYYRGTGDVMGAKVYKGNGNCKKLLSICERDNANNTTYYAFQNIGNTNIQHTITNHDEFRGYIGETFDKDRLKGMERIESFLINHGDEPKHNVYEIGIRKCIAEWRKGVELRVSEDEFFIHLCTDTTEYIYSIYPDNTNIYCGCSYTIPFELGLRTYGQYFRIRNYKDNSDNFCSFYCRFDYCIPQEIKQADGIMLGNNAFDKCGFMCWFVKRYKDDEIVLSGCGDDEYIFRKDMDKLESFM